jgi:Bacterial transglutaminase-like cysteine proteinase BTLCP
MIAEIFPEAYDTEGRPTFRPDLKRRSRFPSTFPFGSYVSQPLTVKCNSLEDLRVFLRKCRYVSDEEQFGEKEYWMPPQDFERSRKGDCEDFSLYAWRQLFEMGYRTRFVGGTVGDSPMGHAWVTFQKDGKHYLLEPADCCLGLETPRLDALRYKPNISAEWDGERAHFFVHQERNFVPPARQIPLLVLEWAFYRLRVALFVAYLLPVGLAKLTYRKLFQRKNRDQRP